MNKNNYSNMILADVEQSVEKAFDMRQSKNLIEQIGHLNHQMTDFAENNALMKADLEKASFEKSVWFEKVTYLNTEIASWKEKAESLEAKYIAKGEGGRHAPDHGGGVIARSTLDALLTLLSTVEKNESSARQDDGPHHQALCSIVTALLPRPVATWTFDDAFNVIGYYETYGVSGCIEAIRQTDVATTYHGWATSRMADFTALLVTVYDSEGCIGVAAPSTTRLDVAAELNGCAPRCGFTIDLTRPPRNGAKVYFQVAQRRGEPVTFALSGT